MTKSRIQLLQAMPVFGGVNEKILSFLIDQAHLVNVSKGRYFFREGDPGESMYVIIEGDVAIIKTWCGQNYVLRNMQYGDSFGEMALIDLFPRSASVRAINDTRAIEITHGLLYQIYEKDIEQFAMIQMNMGRELSRRLRRADELIFKVKMEHIIPEDEHRFHTV
jgi:CRP/FNR family cyclic AMP-dependent transcriptional regulator